jgi:hypothetical protein
MDTAQLQRIQAIADLIRRSDAAALENTELANGVAISLMHDAIEHSLNFVLLDLDHNAKPKDDFKGLVGDVGKLVKDKTGEELPYANKLNLLNTARVAFKHHGIRPTRSIALEATAYGTQFISTLFQKLYNFNIEDFHPAEFLRIAELRNLLVEAIGLSKDGKIDDAMCKLAVANLRINNAVGAVFVPPRAPLRMSSSLGGDRDFRDLIEYVQSGDKQTLVSALMVAAGQDVAAYSTMIMRLPVVYWHPNDTFSFDRIIPNPYTADDVQLCLRELLKIAEWLEHRFPHLDFQDGKWITGIVSPWPN